jgi:hypothetical protein
MRSGRVDAWLKRWAQGYEVAGREYATLLVLPDEFPDLDWVS